MESTLVITWAPSLIYCYLGWVLRLIFTSQTSINIKSHKANRTIWRKTQSVVKKIQKDFCWIWILGLVNSYYKFGMLHWISMLMWMHFPFLHNHGGRLYIHTNTGQVLCVLLWLPNGLSPSVLTHSLMFLGSSPKVGYSKSNDFHCLASEVCLSILSATSFSSSFFGLFLSACQRISFAYLGSVKSRCRRGMIGRYHSTFRGAVFFPFLYQAAPHTGHAVFFASFSR